MGKVRRKRTTRSRKVNRKLSIGQDESGASSSTTGPPAEPTSPTSVPQDPMPTQQSSLAQPAPAVPGTSRPFRITPDTPRYWNYGQNRANAYASSSRGGKALSKFNPDPPTDGIEILCELPKNKTPIEVRGVVPPFVFGELAYVVRFRHDVTGHLSSAYVHHKIFKETHPQLLIQCYEKHTVFSVDNRTDEELTAALRKNTIETPKEDSSDSEDEDAKRAGRVPLLMSDSSDTETESDSDVYEKIDLDAYLAKYK